jgi:[ribosomal protein S5]-alanine N-acetyltransferase
MVDSELRRGKQIGLRPITAADASPQYLAWLNDHEINRYLESRFGVHTIESLRLFLEETTARDDILFFAMIELESGRHVGNIKVGPVDSRHRTADLGLLIGEKECWGRGYGTEAITLATELAFERLDLRKLTASCYGENAGSAAAFRKAGWTDEGRRPAQFLLDGEPQDQLLFGIVRDDSC